MTEATWWNERRFGMFIHMNIATVPAFAPVQEYADWYWAFWQDPPLPDIVMHPDAPFPEVRAFHREHHPDVKVFDDFIPGLSLDHFDAGAIVELARDAGMRYLVPVTKHHDGYCWWDSELTDRTSTKTAPQRDVIAELARATAEQGLTFGVYHSILDWSHPDFPDAVAFVEGYLHPQVRELVERFRPAVLWGDGHWGQAPHHWRAQELVDECRGRLAADGVELMVNDRWGLAAPDFVTFEYDIPDDPPDTPWELCRGMSHSFCFNRAEEDDDHLTPRDVVDLLTEVVAKGGNFLLNIGPKADGSVPEIQADTLRAAGAWVNANADVIHGSERFDVWGDGPIRYTRRDGRVNVIDLDGAPGLHLPHFSPHRYPIEAVDGAAQWQQDETGLHLRRGGGDAGLGAVYRLTVRPQAGTRLRVVGVRSEGEVRIGHTTYASIGAALQAAEPGDVVEVGDGRYGRETETFPLRVPAGVVLKGAGDAVLDAGRATFGVPVVQLEGDGAAIERLELTGVPEPVFLLAAPAVMSSGASHAAVRDCTVHGAIVVHGGADVEIAWNTVLRGNIAAMGCERVAVTGNRQSGLRWGAGIDLNDGSGHRVDANEVEGDLCGVRLRRASGATVTGNRCTTRWWGVEIRGCRDTEVVGNRLVRTMRATNVNGGSGNRVAANVAERCDSGVLVEGGAEGTRVEGNRLDGCRVGILLWNDRDTVVGTNAVTGSRDHDRVVGP